MKNSFVLSAALLTLSISPLVLADTTDTNNELISNGSFEHYRTDTQSVVKTNGRSKWVLFDNWQGYGEIWNEQAGKAATEGDYKIELDVGKNIDSLSQTITTQQGHQYRLRFDAYARSQKHLDSADIEVLLDNKLIVTITPTAQWSQYEALFFGTGGEQSLTLREVAAQDNGFGAIIDQVSLRATGVTNVEAALNSGTLKGVNELALLDATLDELAKAKATPALLSALYAGESIQYTPGKSSQVMLVPAHSPHTFPMLVGTQGKLLGVAGERGQARYAALGKSPFNLFAQSESLSFEAPTRRLLSWLMAGSTDTSVLTTKKQLAVYSISATARRNLKSWLGHNAPSWSVTECNDVASLNHCLTDADLLITDGGEIEDTTASKPILSAYMANNKPIFYINTRDSRVTDAHKMVGALMGFSLPYGGNWWSIDTANWSTADQMQQKVWDTQGLAPVTTLVQHLKAADYAFDWSQCEKDKCDKVVGLEREFLAGATKVREIMRELDQSKTNIFTQQPFRLYKLLALLGDKYRQGVTYPMDKNTTGDMAFLKSYYADHAAYYYRSINPVQADMGNFSRSDFSHITPSTKTVTLKSKPSFRSTGVYILPGQSVEITRTDTSALSTKLFINTLRASATHEFATNGYTRPKFLQSPKIDIATGETIHLSSPYGGPVQIEFDQSDLTASFTFRNVGEHPYWRTANDDAQFAQQLTAGDYDWAELATPGFEIHSKLDKMRESMSDPKWGSAQALSNATMRYMHNYPHVLAGFQGEGIDVVPELHNFAAQNGWSIDTLDKVKHMNADQASCGTGCSGNPYDAYWAYDPIGHGDVHELGHGLQGSLRFNGWVNHTMTNFYAFYTKAKYFEHTGNAPECKALPFERMFTILQDSVAQDDPKSYIQRTLWDKMGWSEGSALFIQMMMAAQKEGVLADGWLLRARLHLLEREYNRAKSSATTWNEKRNKLGFSQYSLSDLTGLDDNDWHLIALSYVTGRNFTQYFDMWALPYSLKAKAQVSTLAYPMMPSLYFKSAGASYCTSFSRAE